MNIFISMKVPRTDKDLSRAADLLAAAVKSAGHLPFVATNEIARQCLNNPRDFMPFVRSQLRDADLVILLNHPELRGGLIEAGIAYAWEIPIWLCHKPGERISSSLQGCADVTIVYETLEALQNNISSQLKERAF